MEVINDLIGFIEYSKDDYAISFSLYNTEAKELMDCLKDYKRLKELELKNEA